MLVAVIDRIVVDHTVDLLTVGRLFVQGVWLGTQVVKVPVQVVSL